MNIFTIDFQKILDIFPNTTHSVIDYLLTYEYTTYELTKMR